MLRLEDVTASVCDMINLYILYIPYSILHTGSVINKVVGAIVTLLGLLLCLFGHRFFDIGKYCMQLCTLTMGSVHCMPTGMLINMFIGLKVR